MSIFTKSDRVFAEAVSRLSFSNPFLEERVLYEKEALGKDFDETTRPFWSWTLHDEADRPNVINLTKKVFEVARRVREKISAGQNLSDADMELYDDLAHYVVYYKTIAYEAGSSPTPPVSTATWSEFASAFEYWMNIDGVKSPCYGQKAHVYAYLSQLQRAFFNIFLCVIGRSRPIAKLRARIWQSIFTHDMRRYRRTLYDRMREVTTLVTGPSGTGKELVARAVGMSQYRPFDLKTQTFEGEGDDAFFAVNLSALSPTLIESELFGHAKGSFTGATTSRKGFLEAAGRYGCVFLDEIGELDLGIQVKLLRVLQSRTFQRIGELKTNTFEGKIISATNRDLLHEIQAGQFRNDFYYRICSDIIETPSLREQLVDRPDEIEFLVSFLSERIAPGEQKELTQDVLQWFESKQPDDYHWPGNIRELEQCVRNIMIHNDYSPQTHLTQNSGAGSGAKSDSLAKLIRNVELTAEELVGRYCEIAYAKTNSYEKAANRLKLDRRTVRAKIAVINE